MPYIPKELAANLKNGNCAIFIGAGISKMAGGPTWEELLKPLAEKHRIKFHRNYARLAQEIQDEIGNRSKFINEIFKEIRNLEPDDFHVDLLTTLPIKYWITTNYDDLLETAFRKKRISRHVIRVPQHLPFTKTEKKTERSKIILKLHGDFDFPGNLIITESDYHEHYRSNNLILNEFQSLNIDMPFLFLGYSMSDPDINALLSHVASQLGNLKNPLYAVFFEPDSLKNITQRTGLDITPIDGTVLPGETISEKCKVFVKALKKRSEEQKKIFLVSDFENWFEERELLKEFRDAQIEAKHARDWPLQENFEHWLRQQFEKTHIVVVFPPEFPVNNCFFEKQLLTGISEGCRIVQFHQNGNKSALVQFCKKMDIAFEALMRDIFSAPNTPERAVTNFIREYKVVKTNSRITDVYANQKISDLLKEAKKQNHHIPSDIIPDKMFISNPSKLLIEAAYKREDGIGVEQEDKLRAKLEYARLLRFQGKWEKASRLLSMVLNNQLKEQSSNENLKNLYIEFIAERGSLQVEQGFVGGIAKVEYALQLLSEGKLNPNLVKLLKMLGNLYREQGRWRQAERYLQSACNLSEIFKNVFDSKQAETNTLTKKILWLDSRREYAGLLLQQDKFSETEKELQDILEEIEEIKKLDEEARKIIEHFEAIVKYLLGQLFARTGKPRQALEFLQECLNILQKYDNPVRIAFVLDWIGRAMSFQTPPPDLESAENYIRKAKRLREKSNHLYFLAYTDLALGNLYRRRGILNKHDQYFTKADKAYTNALNIFKDLDKKRSIGMALFLLGINETQKPNCKVDLAKFYFLPAIEVFKKMEVPYEAGIREVNFEILKLTARNKELEELIEDAKKIEESTDNTKKNQKHELYLSEVGEYTFHNWLKKFISPYDRDFNNNQDYPVKIKVGIGDDAAVLEFKENSIRPAEYEMVLTTDAAPGSICKSHEVEKGKYAAKFSVIHSVSDLLAMGATPVAVLLNMYLDRNARAKYAVEVIKVIANEASKYNAALVGGDVKERKEQSIGCVGVGVIPKGQKSIVRNTARNGQIVAISLAGFRNLGNDSNRIRKIGKRWATDILEMRKEQIDNGTVLGKYLKRYGEEENIKESLLFLPYNEMLAAAKTGNIQSGIDTSDGFMSCLQILGRESEVNFVLEEKLVTDVIDDEVKEIAEELQFHPAQFLFNAGHDWEIVMTVREEDFKNVQRVFVEAGGNLAPLGRVVEKNETFQNEIGLYREDKKIKKIPIFTDEKFVRGPYEERATEWEDISVHYYLSKGVSVEDTVQYTQVPGDFRIS